MAVLTPQAISIDGTTVAFSAAAVGGDSCPPGDRTFVRAKNPTGASITLTVVVPGTEYGEARPDVPIVIPAAGEVSFGPLEPTYADPVSHNVGFTYSAAGLTLAALTI